MAQKNIKYVMLQKCPYGTIQAFFIFTGVLHKNDCFANDRILSFGSKKLWQTINFPHMLIDLLRNYAGPQLERAFVEAIKLCKKTLDEHMYVRYNVRKCSRAPSQYICECSIARLESRNRGTIVHEYENTRFGQNICLLLTLCLVGEGLFL
ncbi:MAG: hypothetical protein FWC73_02820 [Defluviitaleaceae bacterium]|nr:hypothetical protein [Defluviitaleaceae bacterium]